MEATVVVAENKSAAGEEPKNNGEHGEHAAVDGCGESELSSAVTAAKNGKLEEHAAVNGCGGSETSRAITAAKSYKRKENEIQVSNTKKPLIFYLNLAKKYIKLYNGVQLCALGMAIPTVVLISENLKRNGLATQKNIMISTVNAKEDQKGRVFQKAKIEILLVKAAKMDQSTVAATSKTHADNKA